MADLTIQDFTGLLTDPTPESIPAGAATAGEDFVLTHRGPGDQGQALQNGLGSTRIYAETLADPERTDLSVFAHEPGDFNRSSGAVLSCLDHGLAAARQSGQVVGLWAHEDTIPDPWVAPEPVEAMAFGQNAESIAWMFDFGTKSWIPFESGGAWPNADHEEYVGLEGPPYFQCLDGMAVELDAEILVIGEILLP